MMVTLLGLMVHCADCLQFFGKMRPGGVSFLIVARVEGSRFCNICRAMSFTKMCSKLSVCLALIGLLSAEEAEKPNIILVMTDDQGYGDLAAHGHPFLKTPNLDRLHAKSVRLTDFHVSPTCAPTRAALMSGMSPFKVGVTHTVLERERMALGYKTVADVLKSAGYTTGIFGKWHLGDADEYQPGERGFDEVFIHGAGRHRAAIPGESGSGAGNGVL